MTSAQGSHPPGTVGVSLGDLSRYTDFWRSILSMQIPPGSQISTAAGQEIAVNRNALVEQALGANSAWLWFLDDDQVVEPTTFSRLADTAARESYDVVCPLILRRTGPWDTVASITDPCDGEAESFQPGTLTGSVEVAVAGTGGMLIGRHVLEALEPPWFRVGQIDPTHYQEDIEFCRRVRRAGFKIGLDIDTRMGHIAQFAIWPTKDQHGQHLVCLIDTHGTVVPITQFVRPAGETPALASERTKER